MKFYTLLLLIFLHGITNAQYDNSNKRDSLKIIDAKYSYHILSAEKNKQSEVRLPYDTIIFKDVRFDTTFFAMSFPILRVSKTYNIKENLFGAFIYNIVGLPIAAGILYPFIGLLLNPIIAGAAMALSSVTVVSNANRLRWFKITEKT